jgi:hypothetical protein
VHFELLVLRIEFVAFFDRNEVGNFLVFFNLLKDELIKRIGLIYCELFKTVILEGCKDQIRVASFWRCVFFVQNVV